MPADELSERHTPLDDVWPREARRLREHLGESRSLTACLDRFEAYLLRRLPRTPAIHPAIAEALVHMRDRSVAESVARSGYSHRAFIALFRREVGLAPKAFARIIRFQRASARLAQGRAVSLAETAFMAGYADQAHLSREFAATAGLSPAAYRAAHPAAVNHVPTSNLFKTGGVG
jgi:methylphosphotriester-DNA--protein-cysteine methyltransferase